MQKHVFYIDLCPLLAPVGGVRLMPTGGLPVKSKSAVPLPAMPPKNDPPPPVPKMDPPRPDPHKTNEPDSGGRKHTVAKC